MEISKPVHLSSDQLRWRCSPDVFEFETTSAIEIQDSIVGQETAREALMFGIKCLAEGQNVYVRGSRGTGRITTVRQMLRELQPTTSGKRDRCYVNNFARPDRPRLLTLPAGQATQFKRRMLEFAEFVQDGLRKALDGEPHVGRREAARSRLQQEMQGISAPLEKELAENNLVLVTLNQGPVNATVIAPTVDGEPVPPEQLAVLIKEGKVPEQALEDFQTKVPGFQKELDRVSREMNGFVRRAKQEMEQLRQAAAREVLGPLEQHLRSDYPYPEVQAFLQDVLKDVVENQLDQSENEIDYVALYGVNIILQNDVGPLAPIVEEVVPSMMNLLGTVDVSFGPQSMPMSDYRGIRGGAILSADSGYLLLEVEDLLSEPGAYRALMRTLRTRKLEIVPPEAGWMRPYVVVQPEPIPIKLRVILIGDVQTFYRLDALDPDFRELFKVLADFEDQIGREQESFQQYAIVVARLVKVENLLPFHRSGVARLIEHGARIVARDGKLTAKFGRIADIAREAAFLAQQADKAAVDAEDVRVAILRTKARANLPSRRFQEFVDQGTIVIRTAGVEVGQINGLAVMRSGPLTYGFPARITATIGPGSAGLIDIEGSSRMSGTIHTKGFHILGGLLRHLLHTNHPLSFSASVAFEQSYGGIDGDSASGAEMICLLSALTDIPIRQDLAITGAIDQHGRIQAIGGVNEKIEGFYDTCRAAGFTGTQGVVIPKANAGDLMLREDVVEACEAGQFHVYSVDSIYAAIELFTGKPTQPAGASGYDEDSVLGIAVRRAREFWEKTLAAPVRLTQSQTAPAPQTPPPTDPLPPPEKLNNKNT